MRRDIGKLNKYGKKLEIPSLGRWNLFVIISDQLLCCQSSCISTLPKITNGRAMVVISIVFGDDYNPTRLLKVED